MSCDSSRPDPQGQQRPRGTPAGDAASGERQGDEESGLSLARRLRATLREAAGPLLLDLGSAFFTLVVLLIAFALWRSVGLSPLWLVTAAVLGSVWLCGKRAGFTSAAVSALAATAYLAIGARSVALIVIGVVQLIVFLLIARILADRLDQARASLEQIKALRAQHEQAEEERTQLLARHESARLEAETARRRLAILAAASNQLAASLDYEATVSRFCTIATESIADWCVVDLLQPDGSLSRVAGACSEADKRPLVDQLRSYPPDPKGGDLVARALFTGQPEMVQQADLSDLAVYALDETHQRLIRDLDIGSFLILPLTARGRTFGAVTLVRHSASRAYAADDLGFATDLIHRAALAIDSAYLYREAQAEIRERRRVERMLNEHRARIEVLNERLQQAMVETHHRVKNNLQVIAAMVDLQTMDGNETVPSGEIKRLGSQVRTLAAVHDILTQTAKTDSQAECVSAAAILERLLPMLAQTATTHLISSHLEDAPLPARQGTALGLIVNELVSNGIKHGRNQVEVRMEVREGNAILQVNDDGPGFPPGFDPAKAANTGLELVENLTRWDLAGRSRYSSRPAGGAAVAIEFPLSASAASPMCEPAGGGLIGRVAPTQSIVSRPEAPSA